MRIGFIGTGNFAKQHAEILRDINVEITACYGTNDAKTAEFSKQFNVPIFDKPLALITTEVIDALYIVIPPFAHDGQVELTAIHKNIPFLCEKPVGLDLKLCRQIARNIAQNNLITSSGYLLRYEPIFDKIKAIIARNNISTIRTCSYSYMPAVSWWRQESLSGGMMVESGSHYIDLLRYLFGEIVSVASVTADGLAINSIDNCNVYDSMEAILKFASGKIASIGVTHLLNTIQARNDMLEIYGQNFVLKLDLYKLRYKNEVIIIYKESKDKEWQTILGDSSKKGLLKDQSVAFMRAVQENKRELIKSSYADAVKTLQISLAMNESAKENNFISV